MSGDLKRQFGNRIRQLREAQGLTQEQLAERIGRSVETIGSIERGINGTRIETAQDLATALGVRLHELFQLEDKTPPEPNAREQAISALIAMLGDADVGTIKRMAALVRAGLDLAKA